LSLHRPLFALGAFVLVVSSTAFAQPNVVAGRNVKLQSLNGFLALGRSGTFPNGINGCAESTTSCNPGTNNIPWNQAMAETHPFISFIAARQTNGRLEQISDYSFVKHGFFATNSPGCGTCQNPGTPSLLGMNCTDTYSTTNNGDNFWLAPADEINPWTGAWEATCSHFDKGEPPVAVPQQCDGNRSLTAGQASALGVVGHRMRIPDSAFNVPGSTFHVYSQYTTQGEAESLRGDNQGWRNFTPNWTGSSWSISVSGTLQYNSILSAWSGATLNSNTNGADDGRVYVAVRVTGPVAGVYHYEYAVHNRDNARGIGAFKLPICGNASISNVGFKDVDTDAGNDWTFSNSGTEIAWTAGATPLRWNSFYNFWFDSTQAPVAASSTLVQAAPGAGAASFTVNTQAPGGAPSAVTNLGGGCGSPAAPNLASLGAPTVPNPAWGLQATNLASGAPCQLWASILDASLPLNANCTLNMNVAGLILQLPLSADGSGVVTLPAAIPADPLLVGVHVNFALFELQAGGAIQSQADLSNTLRVQFGDC
jgi:hypothetical protein